MRRVIGILFMALMVLVAASLYRLYSFPSPEEVKPMIQHFLDVEYGSRFRIVEVRKDHNPDLFKEPWGYALVLEDVHGVKFGNVRVQDNEVQGWITFGGTDVEAEYRKALQP